MKSLIILILATFLQCSHQAFNPFLRFVTTTRNPPRSRRPRVLFNDENYCNNKKRTWTSCTGKPLMRFTNDQCATRNATCGTGQIIASAFVKSLTTPTDITSVELPSAIKIDNSGYSNFGSNLIDYGALTPTTISPATRCTTDSTLVGGSLGNCNKRSRTKRQTRTLSYPNRDIMILMDESGSIGSKKFGRVKEIASAIVKLLCGRQSIALDQTRIGVTSFDSRVHSHIILEEKGSQQYLNWKADRIAAKINSIRYTSATQGSTCLYEALRYTHTESFSRQQGGRRRVPNIAQEIILITDGCETCGGDLEEMRNNLVSTGVSVYVIGVGLDKTCEDTIKILAQGGKCYHFFFMDTWGNEFEQFIQYLVDEAKIPRDQRDCNMGQLYSDNRACQ